MTKYSLLLLAVKMAPAPYTLLCFHASDWSSHSSLDEEEGKYWNLQIKQHISFYWSKCPSTGQTQKYKNYLYNVLGLNFHCPWFCLRKKLIWSFQISDHVERDPADHFGRWKDHFRRCVCTAQPFHFVFLGATLFQLMRGEEVIFEVTSCAYTACASSHHSSSLKEKVFMLGIKEILNNLPSSYPRKW